MNNFNILHYSFGIAPKSTGGLPLYVRDLIDAQKENGYNVNLLLPKQKLNGKDKITKKGNIYYLENSLPISSVFGIKDPKDYISPYNKSVIEEFLNELKPDVIHVHSFMGLPKEFLEIAKQKKVKLIYTTHDYYGLCLKCNFIDSLGRVCMDLDPKKCTKCNLVNGINTKISYLIASDFYKFIKRNTIVTNIKNFYRRKKINMNDRLKNINVSVSEEQIFQYKKLIAYYFSMFKLIDKFHFNSVLTKEVYTEFLGDLNGKIIPITLKHIRDNSSNRNKKVEDKIIFGYIGRNEPYKGVYLLMNSLTLLHQMNVDFKCFLFGDEFKNLDGKLNGKIENKGVYNSLNIGSVFNSIDVLIVPSICKETFGFVVLEALSYGVPVLLSENVGSKYLLKDNPQNIFKNSEDDLLNKLVDVCNGNKKKYCVKNISQYFNIYNHANNMVEFYKGTD